MATAAPPSENSSNGSTIRNHDLLALKAFVQAQDATQYDNVNANLVVLDLTHSNLRQQHIEIRFAKSDPVSILQERIHRKTGTPPHHQHLQIMDGEIMVAEIPSYTNTTTDFSSYPLGYFGLVHHGMRVHCIDTNPASASAGGALEDTSLVEKYVMSEPDYNARSGTLRDWKRQQEQKDATFNLRQYAEDKRALAEATRLHRQGLPLPDGFYIDSRGIIVKETPDVDDDMEHCNKRKENAAEENMTDPCSCLTETTISIQVGDRCEVQPGHRRGRIAYVGKIDELGPGEWIGVVFDEPVGQNDGSTTSGRVIMETPGPRYGGFVRARNLQVGDFPERDIFDDLNDLEDEL